MGWQIVEDDDIALGQGGRQLGLDPGIEDLPVHGLIDDEGCGQAIAAQPGDEGLYLPVSERRLGSQPVTFEAATAWPRHLGIGAGLIHEDQSIRLTSHPRLALGDPFGAGGMNVRAILFRRQQCFFYSDSRCASTSATTKRARSAPPSSPSRRPVPAS